MKKHIFCLVLSLGIGCMAGCAPASREDSFSFDYSLESNEAGFSCSTGSVQASSLHDYCTNLLNDPLNNYCARPERLEMFRDKNCQQLIGIAGM